MSLDKYSSREIQDILYWPLEDWPDDIVEWINGEIADELLEEWLDNTNDEEYTAKARLIATRNR